MHELALARSLTDMVDEYAAQQGVARIKQINIRLGELSAMTRALHFCFGSASQGTSCENAILNIEEVPLTVFCSVCDEIKTPNGRYNFRCPDCGRSTPNVVTGREMELNSIELYDTDYVTDAPMHREQPTSQLNATAN
jgi:hydrogenase nickel incorporation protein HypA/HybF